MAKLTLLPFFAITLLVAVMMELQAQNFNPNVNGYNNNNNNKYNNYGQPPLQPLSLRPPSNEQPRQPEPPHPPGVEPFSGVPPPEPYRPPAAYQPGPPDAAPADASPPEASPPDRPASPQGAPRSAAQALESPASSSVPIVGSLDKTHRDFLQKFDDFLFENLQQVYFRMSYAFKDVLKKTLDKCGCDAGAPIAGGKKGAAPKK